MGIREEDELPRLIKSQSERWTDKWMIRTMLATTRMTIDAEQAVLAKTLDRWAAYRSAHAADVGKDGRILFPTDLNDAWLRGGGIVFEALVENPKVNSHRVIACVLQEVQADLPYTYQASDGLVRYPVSFYALSVCLAHKGSGDNLTAEQQQHVMDIVLRNGGGSVPGTLLDEASLHSWFQWRGDSLVQLMNELPSGREALGRMSEGIDAETWLGLAPGWKGTVDGLIAACGLVSR